MPIIDIREYDNTTPAPITLDDYVVVVYGGCNASITTISEELKDFVLLDNVEQLVNKFGKCPTYGDGSASDPKVDVNSPFYDANNKKMIDPGYLTAYFLLNKGYKVLYRAVLKKTATVVNSTTTTTYSAFDNWNDLVAAFDDSNYEDLYANLDDKGLYTIDFLTLGGYIVAQDNFTKIDGGFPYYDKVTLTAETYRPDTYYYINDEQYVLDTSQTITSGRTYYEKYNYAANTYYYVDSYNQYVLDENETKTAGRDYYRYTSISKAIDTLKTIVEKRGDCTLLLDHKFDITDGGTILKIAQSNATKYAVMYSPWEQNTISGIAMKTPASVAYLEGFINSVENNPEFFAVAGPLRGGVTGKPLYNYGENKANSLQGDYGCSVNPITNINPFGILIWGNRTLNKNTNGLVASSFQNIRILCNRLKKQLYLSSKSYMFEQNDDRLWFNFKSDIQAMLDKIKSGRGIKAYNIVKVDTKEKATLAAIVQIIPTYAVEKFDILVELSDSFVNVEEQ